MQPQASQHPESSATPLAELLGRASAELGDIAAAVERMHPLVQAQTQQTAAHDPHYLQALQSFDHIEQKLRSLAGFLADLAGATAPDWQLDPQAALAAITLSDLAARLAGDAPLAAPQNATSGGDCEMF